MKHRPRAEEQDDLLRPLLVDMIDQRHELVKLAALIDWEVFEREWAGFFPSGKGRPATEPRLVAGLLYLQDANRLSDEAVVARWVEDPYFQHGHDLVFVATKSAEAQKIDVAANADVLLDRDVIKANQAPTSANHLRAAGARLIIDGSPRGFTAWRDRHDSASVGSDDVIVP